MKLTERALDLLKGNAFRPRSKRFKHAVYIHDRNVVRFPYMPIDPFFTSKVKDDFGEKKDKSRAYAKALQIKRFLGIVPKKSKTTILSELATNPDVFAARALRGRAVQVEGPGRPSLTGFKPPVRKWEHRKH